MFKKTHPSSRSPWSEDLQNDKTIWPQSRATLGNPVGNFCRGGSVEGFDHMEEKTGKTVIYAEWIDICILYTVIFSVYLV